MSDDSYISDFSGNIRESSESVLPQEYTLTYDETYWNTFLRVTKNQTLDIEDLDTEPYERVPQFLWRGHTGDFNGFELETVLEATRFQHTRSDYVDGSRFVFHQTVSYPLAGPGWFITRRRIVPRHVLRPRFARLHQQHDAGHDGPDPES